LKGEKEGGSDSDEEGGGRRNNFNRIYSSTNLSLGEEEMISEKGRGRGGLCYPIHSSFPWHEEKGKEEEGEEGRGKKSSPGAKSVSRRE